MAARGKKRKKNTLDHDPIDPEDQALFDQGIDEFFEKLFEQEKAGKIRLDQVEDFFPDEVQKRNTEEDE